MKIFIGSANESETDARNIEYILSELNCDCYIWTKAGMFIPSESTLENIEQFTKNYDAAVFVYGENDKLESRGQLFKSVRDNVVLETGTFIGKRGHKNVAIYIKGKSKMPSDLLGLTVINGDNDIGTIKTEFKAWISSVEKDKQTNKTSNITMLERSIVDNQTRIEDRWKYAKEIIFVNYASTAFIAASEVVPDYVANKSLRELYLEKLQNGCNFKFLITEPNTFADFDAAYSKMNVISKKGIVASNIIQYGLDGLKKDYESLVQNRKLNCGDLEFATTDICLPYGMVFVSNDTKHKDLDYIKVDLYSPFISDDNTRRSFLLYQDNENFKFFRNQISTLWGRAKGNSKIKPTVSFEKISNIDIKGSMKNGYELVGTSQGRHQIQKYIYDKKLGINIMNYTESTSTLPLFHTYSTAYFYVIHGECKLCVKENDKVKHEHLYEGDFCVVPKLTPYALKACGKTCILSIKTPNIFDEVHYSDDNSLNLFGQAWED